MQSPPKLSKKKWPDARLVVNLRRNTKAEDVAPPNPDNPSLDTLKRDNPDFCISCIVNILDLGQGVRALVDKRARDVQFDVLEQSAKAGCCLCGPAWRDYGKLGLGFGEFERIMFQGSRKDISVYIKTFSAANKAASTIPVSVSRELEDLKGEKHLHRYLPSCYSSVLSE